MKKLIYRYLNKVYYLQNVVIRYVSDDKTVTINKISKDLQTVFGLTQKKTKWYLKGWCKKTNKSFPFNKAWDSGWKNTVYVESGVRRLTTTWTVETEYDLFYYHGIDAETELTRILSEEINRQILEGVIEQYEKINP